MSDPGERSRRALRLFPRSWRERYGEEFAALLEQQYGEAPRSRRRTFDILRAAGKSHLEGTGLIGPLPPEAGRRALGIPTAVVGAVSFSLSSAAYFALAATYDRRDSFGLALFEVVGGVGAILAALAVVPVVRAAKANRRAASRNRVRRPLWVALSAGLAFVAGTVVIAATTSEATLMGYPTRALPARPWSPGHLALSASVGLNLGNWSHLPSQPGLIEVWMPLSVCLFAVVAAGGAIAARRFALPPGVVRFESLVAVLVVVVMVVGLVVSLEWSPGPLSNATGIRRAMALVPLGAMILSVLVTAEGARRAVSSIRRVARP